MWEVEWEVDCSCCLPCLKLIEMKQKTYGLKDYLSGGFPQARSDQFPLTSSLEFPSHRGGCLGSWMLDVGLAYFSHLPECDMFTKPCTYFCSSCVVSHGHQLCRSSRGLSAQCLLLVEL